MSTPPIFRALWLAGGLALLLGALRGPVLELIPPPRGLPRADGATGRPWVTGEFAATRALPGITDTLRLGALEVATSHVNGDGDRGRAETAWFRTSTSVTRAAVAGYTHHAGIKLWAEWRDPTGKIHRIDCPLTDPRETWALWEIDRPPEARELRLIAEDRTAAHTGWIAFSHPFRSWPPELESAWSLAQLTTTFALTLILLWGPGLLAGPRDASSAMRCMWFLGAGPLALAAAGICVWALGPWIRPAVTGTFFTAGIWLAVGFAARRRKFDLKLDLPFARALTVAALVAGAVTARAAYSAGPAGELFRGTVSRNFALSDRIDSRFSFYAVQAAANIRGPASPATERFYYPWTFFSRGPLAGLAAIPVVLGTGGRPPGVHAEQVWTPFDRQGFAAYRVTQHVLSAGVFVAFFLLLLPLTGPGWALFGCGMAALAPFGVHEVLFTWPKWTATAWLAAAFALLHAGRPILAGAATGVGFLFHPLVLLWTPWLAVAAMVLAPRRPAEMAAAVIRLAAATAAIVLPWMLLGALMPHLPDTPFAGQGGFMRYWLLADSQLTDWDGWLRTRWMNFANTFVPLHLFSDSGSFHHFRFTSAHEASPPAEKTLFLWWNSLPFALGLGLWTAAAVSAKRLIRRHFMAAAVLLLGPAVLLVTYWGGDPLGLMRECGHPLFLSVIGLTIWVAAKDGGRFARIIAHPAVPWLQLPETLVMLWLATWVNAAPYPRMHHQLDWVALAAHLACLLAAAAILARARRDAAASFSP